MARSPAASTATPGPAELTPALHQAFTDLVREHTHPLLRYVSRYTGHDRSLAEDVVQEALLRAWLHPGILGDTDRSPRPWLRTVALNLLRDHLRARRARPTEVDDTAAMLTRPDTTDALDSALDAQLMVEALSRLSDQHREILVHTYYRGLGVTETAALLGIPIGTAKSRAFYALKAIRLVLTELGVRPPAADPNPTPDPAAG